MMWALAKVSIWKEIGTFKTYAKGVFGSILNQNHTIVYMSKLKIRVKTERERKNKNSPKPQPSHKAFGNTMLWAGYAGEIVAQGLWG